MTPPNVSGPGRRRLPPRQPSTAQKTMQAPRTPSGQRQSPSVPSQPVRTTPSLVMKDGFDTAPVGRPNPLQRPALSPLLPRPVQLPGDMFIAGLERRSKARPPESLKLPANVNESVTVSGVPLPTKDSKPTPAQAHVIEAAQRLGFSPEVSAMAAAELQRRLGGDLVIDLGSKKQLVTAEDFQAKAQGATTMPFTFNPTGVAVLKDANLAASLGMDSLESLYMRQGALLPSLREAALAGTDLDFEQELKLVNDPATREGMMAYYEAMRVMRDLGHGRDSAFEALPAAKERLDKAFSALPKGSPLQAQFEAMRTELKGAQTTLLAGTERGGQTPRAAIALMNNVVNAPFGRLPDEDVVTSEIDNIARAAEDKGASPSQVSALREALELGYGLRAQGGSTPERLAANQQRLAQLVRDAGPVAGPLKPLLERVSREATVLPATSQAPSAEQTQANAASHAEAIADLTARLKLAAKQAGIPALPDLLDALKGSVEAAAKGNTAEGLAAALSIGPSLVGGLTELLDKLPEFAGPAKEVLKRFSGAFKVLPDLAGTLSNARKVYSGLDLDGKQVSYDDRIKAGVDLALDNAPSAATSLGTVLLGSESLLVQGLSCPPAMIPLVQAKLMIYVTQEAAQMKTNIATGMVRDRFNLGSGDDAQFKSALNTQLKTIASKPTTRSEQARETAQYLLTGHFKDSDTAARFQAYASSKLLGGRQTVQFLMRGQRPPFFKDQNSPTVTGKEGADLIRVARQLQALATDFYAKEMNDARSMVSVSNGARSGESYMKTSEQRRELEHWLNRR